MRDIVINTGPIIALVTATDSLDWLPALYHRIVIPYEVFQEIKAGRRLARIHGLSVTGSLGILLKAKKQGLIASLSNCITRMREHGIWIAGDLVTDSLREAGEL